MLDVIYIMIGIHILEIQQKKLLTKTYHMGISTCWAHILCHNKNKYLNVTFWQGHVGINIGAAKIIYNVNGTTGQVEWFTVY